MYNKDEQQRLFSSHKPDVVPDKGTTFYNKLNNFSERIRIILLVSNEDEFQAAITLLKPPSSSFKNAVTFPSDGIYLGILAMAKVALVYPGASNAYALQSALKKFPSAEHILGIGACRALEKKHKPGDVLISETISVSKNTQTATDEKKVCDPFERIGYDYLVSKSQRKSEVYSRTYDSFVIAYKRSLFSILRPFLPAYLASLLVSPKSLTDQIGYETEGSKPRNVILIKGVAGYGDKITEELWQFSATRAAVQYIRHAIFYKGRNKCI